MRLNEIQQNFRQLILDQGAYTLPENTSFAALFDTGDIPLEERLETYRANVLIMLGDALKDHYKTFTKLVGDDFATQVTRDYVRRFPPESGCINLYGTDFPAFAAAYPGADALAYIHDVCVFDQARNTAYYAPDDSPLAANDLAGFGEDDYDRPLIIRRKSVWIIRSLWPLKAIYDFAHSDQAVQADARLDLDQGGGIWMIWRPGLKVEIRELEQAEAAMLESLSPERAFNDCVAETLTACPNFDLGSFMKTHLELQTLKKNKEAL